MAGYLRYNNLLNEKLQALSEKDKDYWSFRGKSSREYGHGLFQYPAMMVPQVVESIIDKIKEVHPNITSVRDPFVGSGTVMTEAMLRGLSFFGTDINPLAILLCQVKSGPFFIDELKKKSAELKTRIQEDKKRNIEINFNTKNKWFSRSVQIYLSKIRRSIQAEKEIWARKFFWIALAETVRLTSNSRTSTFKLHIRPDENIKERKKNMQSLDIFYKVLDHNLGEYENLYIKLKDKKLLKNGYYIYNNRILFSDVRNLKNTAKTDIVITSPPYGDNVTTVPYGQHSYLPLQWIDFSDIDKNLDKEELLRTTYEIDNRSLGGHHGITEEEVSQIMQRSETLKKYTRRLYGQLKDRTAKVITFFQDLDKCIEPILEGLNKGGIMVWILGNRRVGGKKVPLDRILSDLFNRYNVEVFCELTRKIPSKRMAIKNNIVKTMSDEIILLMRKVG